MEKVNFDEYPNGRPVNRIIDQLAAFAARTNNTLEGDFLMENKNQNIFYADEEAINAFVEKHVRKSQREKTAALLRSGDAAKALNQLVEAFREACTKEMAAM